MGRGPSLILTALCAFHPVLLRLSGLTLSDVPFAAMFLLTVLIAHFALDAEPKKTASRQDEIVAVLPLVFRKLRRICAALRQ
jgi:predicted membrane-bound mannosyltransferase